MLLRAVEPVREPRRVVLLLLDEIREATVLALGLLDLDLEILRLFGELLDKDLEFEELSAGQRRSFSPTPQSSPSPSPPSPNTHLLLPVLELLDEKVVALGDLADLGVHAAFGRDKVLPRVLGVARVLVALADDLVEVPG